MVSLSRLTLGGRAETDRPGGSQSRCSGTVVLFLCSDCGMTTIKGPAYGSLTLLILVCVVPVALIFGLASAFGGWALAVPIGGSIGMLVLAVMMHRRCTVEVGEKGVTLTMFGPRSFVIPWTDIERMENPPLGLRLVRRGTKRRPFVQFLCPNPLQRPVGRAIRAHLATARHERTP